MRRGASITANYELYTRKTAQKEKLNGIRYSEKKRNAFDRIVYILVPAGELRYSRIDLASVASATEDGTTLVSFRQTK